MKLPSEEIEEIVDGLRKYMPARDDNFYYITAILTFLDQRFKNQQTLIQKAYEGTLS